MATETDADSLIPFIWKRDMLSLYNEPIHPYLDAVLDMTGVSINLQGHLVKKVKPTEVIIND